MVGCSNHIVFNIIRTISFLQCLENFLVRENAGQILQAQRDDANYNLSKNQFNFVLRLLGEFTQHRYGLTPTAKQKEAVAKTFVELFPSVRLVIIVTKMISSLFAPNINFRISNIDS